MTLHEVDIKIEALKRVWAKVNRPGNLSAETKQYFKEKFQQLEDERKRLEKEGGD